MNRKEYQTGNMSITNLENGQFNQWLTERSQNGWTLHTAEFYTNPKSGEQHLFWVLERDVPRVN